jgi:hypothetical protein
MTANAFTAVSLDPVLVLVCVDHRARTHAHLHTRKRFGVNVLRNDQQTISEYYARSRRRISIRKLPAPVSIAPRKARLSCRELWRTWSAGYTRRSPRVITRSSSRKWKRLWSGMASRYCIFAASTVT